MDRTVEKIVIKIIERIYKRNANYEAWTEFVRYLREHKYNRDGYLRMIINSSEIVEWLPFDFARWFYRDHIVKYAIVFKILFPYADDSDMFELYEAFEGPRLKEKGKEERYHYYSETRYFAMSHRRDLANFFIRYNHPLRHIWAQRYLPEYRVW